MVGHLNVSGWTPHNNVLRSSIVTSEALDIFIVSETRLSNCDDFKPNVAGYIFKGFNRSVMHRNAPGTWGGVGFLIRRDLLKEYTFKIVEQCYEGIFGIELTHKAMNIRVLLIACYLPPENSPYGRNVDGFLSHLEQLCYTYSSEYDYILFAGDINARIGVFPDEWKLALVIPLIKQLSLETIFPNYRPVSNLAFVSKVTEKAVINQSSTHIKLACPLPVNQSSYKEGHSTETALIKVQSDILDNGYRPMSRLFCIC